MNKHAVLFAAFFGASVSAFAATNVTLYGRVDVGYEVKDVKGDGKGFADSLSQDTKNKGLRKQNATKVAHEVI